MSALALLALLKVLLSTTAAVANNCSTQPFKVQSLTQRVSCSAILSPETPGSAASWVDKSACSSSTNCNSGSAKTACKSKHTWPCPLRSLSKAVAKSKASLAWGICSAIKRVKATSSKRKAPFSAQLSNWASRCWLVFCLLMMPLLVGFDCFLLKAHPVLQSVPWVVCHKTALRLADHSCPLKTHK